MSALFARHRALFLAVVPVLLFCALSYVWLDRPVALWFKTNLGAAGASVFTQITRFGESQYELVPAALIWLLAWLATRRAAPPLPRLLAIRDGAAWVFVSVAASGLFVDAMKILIGRYRPNELFTHGLYGFSPLHAGWNVASFPSGHSQTAFATMVPLILMLPRWRLVWVALAVLVAGSRVVLSVHYLSDTVMGAWVGTAGAVLTGELVRKYRKKA